MKQIKIRNKNYNCSNAIYYHIQGLESENRLFNMEIKGHEQSEFELSKRIDKAIEYIENKNKYLDRENYYQVFEYRDIYLIPLLDILKGVDKE